MTSKLNRVLLATVAAALCLGFAAHAESWRDIYNRGRDFQNAGLYAEAAHAYARAIELAPDEFFLYNDLGEAHILMNQFAAAVDAFRKALALAPQDATVHTNLGIAYGAMGEYEMAMAAHKKALDINPNHPTAHNNLGHVYEQLGRYDDAIREYKKAIVINTNFLLAQVNLGNALVKKGDYAEGVEAHKRAVQIDPGNASAYNNLAHAYYKLGDYRRAVDNLGRALELDPGNETVRANYEFLKSEHARASVKEPAPPVAVAEAPPPAPDPQAPKPVIEVPIEALPPQVGIDLGSDEVVEVVVGPPRVEPVMEVSPPAAPEGPEKPESAVAAPEEPLLAAEPYVPKGPMQALPSMEEELYYGGVIPSNRRRRTGLLFGPQKEKHIADRQAAQERYGLEQDAPLAPPAPGIKSAPGFPMTAPAVAAAAPSRPAPGPGLAAPLLPPATRFDTSFVEVPDPLFRRRVLLIPFEDARGFANWNPTPGQLLTREVELALRDSGRFRVEIVTPLTEVRRMQDRDLTRFADDNDGDLVILGRIADHGIYYQDKGVSYGIKTKRITEARTLLIMRVEDAVNDKSYASESVLGRIEEHEKVSYVEEYDLLEASIRECARELVRQLVSLLNLE